MTNKKIKNSRRHEYIVKNVKETLTDSYSYSYSLVLFDILEIDAFDDNFYKLVSCYKFLEKKLNHLNSLSNKIINSNNDNDNNVETFKKNVQVIRNPISKAINIQIRRLNKLVKLCAKMAIGFSFAHPVEIPDYEKNNYLVDQQYSHYQIIKGDIKLLNLCTATKSDFEQETKDIVARIYKNFHDSDNSKNRLKEVLKSDNFEKPDNYNVILKDILKVIEVIVNKNRDYKVFSKLNPANKFHLDTEHIIPRNSNEEEKEDAEKNKKLCKWKLGNASLLESFINRPMGNADFICKCNGCYSSDPNGNKHKIHNFRKSNVCYRNSSIKMTRDLLKYNRFSNDEIIDRTEELADVIVEIVFGDKFDGDCKKS